MQAGAHHRILYIGDLLGLAREEVAGLFVQVDRLLDAVVVEHVVLAGLRIPRGDGAVVPRVVVRPVHRQPTPHDRLLLISHLDQLDGLLGLESRVGGLAQRGRGAPTEHLREKWARCLGSDPHVLAALQIQCEHVPVLRLRLRQSERCEHEHGHEALDEAGLQPHIHVRGTATAAAALSMRAQQRRVRGPVALLGRPHNILRCVKWLHRELDLHAPSAASLGDGSATACATVEQLDLACELVRSDVREQLAAEPALVARQPQPARAREVLGRGRRKLKFDR